MRRCAVPTYETLFITLPNLTEEEERATVAALAQVVNEGGGEFAANERMGRRRLAYAIQSCEDGVYSRFLYDSPPSVPKELDRRLRISEKVLRHMTICMEPDWAVASKEQAVRDAAARLEAEASRAAGLDAEAVGAAPLSVEGQPAPRSAAPLLDNVDAEEGEDEEIEGVGGEG